MSAAVLTPPDGACGLTTFVCAAPDRSAVIHAAGIAVEMLALGRADHAACSSDLGAVVERCGAGADVGGSVSAARNILAQPHVTRAVDLLARQLDTCKAMTAPHLNTVIALALAIRGDDPDPDPFTASRAALHEAAHAVVGYLLGARLCSVCVR